MNTLRNKVQLIGHLGADISLKTIPSGAKVANVSMATTDRYFSNGEWKDDTQWHRLILWEKLAERAERDLVKGSYLLVEGRLEHRSYEAADGQTKYITEIKVSNFMLLDKKTNAEQDENLPSAEIASQLDEDGMPY